MFSRPRRPRRLSRTPVITDSSRPANHNQTFTLCRPLKFNTNTTNVQAAALAHARTIQSSDANNSLDQSIDEVKGSIVFTSTYFDGACYSVDLRPLPPAPNF